MKAVFIGLAIVVTAVPYVVPTAEALMDGLTNDRLLAPESKIAASVSMLLAALIGARLIKA